MPVRRTLPPLPFDHGLTPPPERRPGGLLARAAGSLTCEASGAREAPCAQVQAYDDRVEDSTTANTSGARGQAKARSIGREGTAASAQSDTHAATRP